MKYALLIFLSWPLAARAGAPPDQFALKSYDFDPSIPLPRVRPIPPWLLKMWTDLDESPYQAYMPTAREAKVLAAAFDGLPAPMKKTLGERLVAVYFVKGLKGNGLTNWMLDASNRPYVYMILNPAGFQQTLSELLTERDRTLFRGPTDLRVEAGDFPGIVYTVTHESAHAFDFVKSVTPFAEPHFYQVVNPSLPGKLGWDAWVDYTQPGPGADYPLRAKLHFYGFGAPELDPAQAAELCAQWWSSPFASFYGSRSWAEDLAELFVLRHLTQDLHQPLRRVCAGKVYSPWDNPKVRARAQRLVKPLYR